MWKINPFRTLKSKPTHAFEQRIYIHSLNGSWTKKLWKQKYLRDANGIPFSHTNQRWGCALCICAAQAILLWFHYFSFFSLFPVLLSERVEFRISDEKKKRKWAFTWTAVVLHLFLMVSRHQHHYKCYKWADSISNTMYITFKWHIAHASKTEPKTNTQKLRKCFFCFCVFIFSCSLIMANLNFNPIHFVSVVFSFSFALIVFLSLKRSDFVHSNHFPTKSEYFKQFVYFLND